MWTTAWNTSRTLVRLLSFEANQSSELLLINRVAFYKTAAWLTGDDFCKFLLGYLYLHFRHPTIIRTIFVDAFCFFFKPISFGFPDKLKTISDTLLLATLDIKD